MSTLLFGEVDELWRVVRSKPKAEHLAAQTLDRQGLETFCPRLRQKKSTARGPVWFVEALFPGYFFAKFNYPTQHRLVQAASHVLGLLPPQYSEAGRIRESLVMELREEFTEGGAILTVPAHFSPGEEVEITAGALRGTPAKVVRVLSAQERVRVLVEFLGSTREIEVPFLSLLGLRDCRRAVAACAK